MLESSFQVLKDTLAFSCVLAHYISKLEVQLTVDASSVDLGAGISHIPEDGTKQPIANASPNQWRSWLSIELSCRRLLVQLKADQHSGP